MWKFVLLPLLVALGGCQAMNDSNVDPYLQPAFRSEVAAPGANPYLHWQRGF